MTTTTLPGRTVRPREPMLPVWGDRPCPSCRKTTWCLLSADGRRGICQRVRSSVKAGEAGWLHIHEDDPTDRPDRRPHTPPPPPPPPPADADGWPLADWRMLAEGYAFRLTADRADALAAALGLPADCLDAVPLVGWNADDPLGPCWLFPEWNDRGQVVGMLRRFVEPVLVHGEAKTKLLAPGGHRGLTLPHDGWQGTDGPLLLVEGASDVLAAASVGLAAVGRPSNTGGAELLAKVLRRVPAGRDIVVVGENDRKPSGEWPGRAGAEAVSAKLTAAGIAHRVAYPPPEHKDLRAWVVHTDGKGVSL